MKVEFHQAQITVTVRVVDGERSHGVQQIETSILLNTDADWIDARQRIDEAIAQMQAQLDEADGDGD